MKTIKILANDGIHIDGQKALEAAGYQVDTSKIAQDELPTKLNDYDVVIVRSATKIRKDLIDQCPNLKVIARGGVGLDNIDVAYAKEKNIPVYNTPAASSQAVAELVFGHFFTLARFLQNANRDMPTKGNIEFKALKKSYAKGIQLRGKTLGVIGFGRIGQETAKIGLGLGMNVIAADLYVEQATINLDINNQRVPVTLNTVALEKLLAESDFISLHVPSVGKPIIGTDEIAAMKEGVVLVNAARGGVVDEAALLDGLDSGKIFAAGLDVFESEPTPNAALLNHPRISVSPHIGASTVQAQKNIGMELAEKITGFFQN